MGIALLVGFISIILTLVVLFGLFLGGRWMYRKIAGTGEKQSTTTAVEKKDTTSKEDGANNGSAEPTSGDSDPAAQSENTTTQNQQTQTTPAPTPTPIPTTGALPQTGPDQDL
jgi:FtsZ-interacting cell division protein ZipA